MITVAMKKTRLISIVSKPIKIVVVVVVFVVVLFAQNVWSKKSRSKNFIWLNIGLLFRSII